MSCWNDACNEQLEALIGYLKYTKAVRLEMAWPVEAQKDIKPGDILTEIHTDADHRGGDKSQSSFVCWVKHKDYKCGGIPLHWSSKKQTLCADAVSAAEVTAAHHGFKEGMWSLMGLLMAFNHDPHTVTMRADNSVCLNHITGRPTDTVYFCLKAVDARGGYLSDMFNKGFFKASHVESAYNRSDLGTKVPSTMREQEWFRASVGLQWPPAKDGEQEHELRQQGLKDTNGPAPPKTELKDPKDMFYYTDTEAVKQFAAAFYSSKYINVLQSAN